MGKVNVRDFDPRVCMGLRDDVDGPCPHLKAIDADTGRPIVDRLARLEGFGLNALGGGDGPGASDCKCGACGCPLPNLELFEQVPEECPRISEHGGATQ